MVLQIENLQEQLRRTDEWAKAADVKIGIVLAFDGVILAGIIKRTFAAIFDITAASPTKVGYIAVMVLMTWSIGKALLGVLPRLNHRQGRGSLLYYHDISSMPVSAFTRDMNRMTKTQYKEALLHQIHAVSKVVSRKMTCFKDSVLLLIASLIIAWGLEIWLRLQT